MGMLSDRRERREKAEQERLLEDTFAEAFGRPNLKQIKGWKDRELHAQLTANDLKPVERAMAERELRKREAWEAPAGRAYWQSWAAIVISLFALGATLFD